MRRVTRFVPILALSTAALSTVARAEQPHPDFDVAVTAGTDAAMTHEAIVLGGEIPFPFTETWRGHGQLARGRADSAAAMAPNVYMSLRVGLEARRCASPELCLIAGLDAAFMTESYIVGTSDSGTVLGVFDVIQERGGFALVPRLALDLGGAHWRFRPGAEATLSKTLRHGNFGNSDLDGIAATAAIAYRW
jgi:hypothetical protein